VGDPLGVNLARIVGDAAAAARPAKANASVSAAHQMSSRRKRGRAHHQSEAVVLDFVNQEFFAAFFFHAGFLSGRLTSSNAGTCVLSNQDSNVAPQTLQFS
jgi:hypothetical protein